jgi:hypothetical protein
MELYFEGVLDAVTRMGAFQRAHRGTFGRLYAADRDPAFLLGEDRAVAVARDQVAVITYDYEKGYEELVAWGLPMLGEALDTIGVDGPLSRVRFRYENLVDTGAEGTVDLSRFFRVALPRGPGAPGPVETEGLHLAWRQVWPTGTVAVDLAVDEDLADGGDDVLVLGIVAERRGPIGRSDLAAALGEAHDMALWTFEELITDEYRAVLRRPRE